MSRRWRKRRATGTEEKTLQFNTRLTVGRGFKGLKQAIKLEFQLARYDKVGCA